MGGPVLRHRERQLAPRRIGLVDLHFTAQQQQRLLAVLLGTHGEVLVRIETGAAGATGESP